MRVRLVLAAALGLAGLSLGGCSGGSTDNGAAHAGALERITVTITSTNGPHAFSVEVAKTSAQQQQGLMFRTDLTPDQGMLFYPYPGDGGPPREASFWMKDTPTPLDIVFIRPDGSIARIAENTPPFSEKPIPSGEPVGAVLELVGGRTAELGVAAGDHVEWPGRKPAS